MMSLEKVYKLAPSVAVFLGLCVATAVSAELMTGNNSEVDVDASSVSSIQAEDSGGNDGEVLNHSDEASADSADVEGSDAAEPDATNPEAPALQDQALTERNQQCRFFNGNPYLCRQTQGCSYDFRANRCFRADSGQPNGQFCSNYNFNFNMCVSNGCSFDSRSGMCNSFGFPNPYPNPQPNPFMMCRRYNFDYEMCQRSGCQFDFRSGQCIANLNSFPPYYPPFGRNFSCTAVDSGWEEHFGGHTIMGLNQFDAENAALNECRRFHRSCRISQCRMM